MLRFLIVCLAACALAGCTSVLPARPAADALYRLGPLEPTYAAQASITIREPEASRLFSGRFMVTEDETGAVRLIRSVQWTDRATSLMQEAVLDLLSGQGGNVAIAIPGGAPTEFELAWRISDMSIRGQTARCRIEASLLRGPQRELSGQRSISVTAQASGGSDAARALALVEAGRACARETAAFIASVAAD
ncbi:MAG: ABC-type transport auxiliary lipoprotein family protein [Hyphomonas sp.]